MTADESASSSSAGPRIAVDGISYSAARGGEAPRTILHEVTFAVPPGAVFTILGPSGSGKSTLLRIINRLLEPTAGRVLLDGQPTADLPVQELRQRVGMVFQTPALFEGNVTDNVLFGPRLRHKATVESALVEELLARVGLPSDFADKSVDELSGGEAQRVSLARALANRPEVLLLDEPTASLDPSASLRVEESLLRLAAEGDLTFIFVTHNLEQAQRIGDSALLLVDGRVVEQGPVAAMTGDPEDEATRLFMEGRL